MKKAFCLLIFGLFIGVASLCAETYYISSSEGSNLNDGLSEKTPKKDLTTIPKKEVNILFKCGDVFWCSIQGYSDCVFGSYGKGNKPVISGFKVLLNTNAWKKIGEQIWSLDLSNIDNFGGYVEKEPDNTFNNIGFIYNPSKDIIYGRNLEKIDLLSQEMDFYTSSYYATNDIESHPFRLVIVKSSVNPSSYGTLCFPMFRSGFENMVNCQIEGLAVVGFSKMGMMDLNGCLIRDCQIDLIGGSIQVGFRNRARFGNGIELWCDCSNNTITNCLISRTYDCATTIQGGGVISQSPKNNHFIGNRVYKCRQAFEHFLNPSDGSLIHYDNCDFTDNICYLMGDNGFNTPEGRDCNILSYEQKAKPITIKGNVFFGGNHLDGRGIGEGMKDNIIYIFRDQYIFNIHWSENMSPILSGSGDAVKQYISIIPDESKFVILKRNSLKARRIERRIRRKVDWQPVDLHLN